MSNCRLLEMDESQGKMKKSFSHTITWIDRALKYFFYKCNLKSWVISRSYY